MHSMGKDILWHKLSYKYILYTHVIYINIYIYMYIYANKVNIYAYM